MEYKKQYNPEEIKEVTEWFKAHEEQMPKMLDVDKATHISDFPLTVNHYIDIAHAHIENATYSGQIYFLFKMRDAMKEACGIQD